MEYMAVGGIVGSGGNATISECGNTGIVKGSRGCVAGIAGLNGIFQYCYNTGNISGYICRR